MRATRDSAVARPGATEHKPHVTRTEPESTARPGIWTCKRPGSEPTAATTPKSRGCTFATEAPWAGSNVEFTMRNAPRSNFAEAGSEHGSIGRLANVPKFLLIITHAGDRDAGPVSLRLLCTLTVSASGPGLFCH